MTNPVTVYLPLNTYVSVRAFTNAGFQQKVTITPENGPAIVLTGNGEHDTPLPNGNFPIQTPGTSSNPSLGFAVTIGVESNNGSGNWVPSQLIQGTTSVAYYNMAMVISEDYTDNDWNDSCVQFSWWTPPSARS